MVDAAFHFHAVDPLGKDRDAYQQLHNHLFASTAMSLEWVNWYHDRVAEAAGGRVARTYGAFLGSDLIGIWSVEPRRFRLDGTRPLPVGRCFAVGIHSDYRRHGLFVELSKYAIEQERLRGELEFIVGFPQKGRAVVGGHIKAGWHIVQELAVYSVDIGPGDVTTSLSAVRAIHSFGDIPLEPFDGSFATSERYLEERWLNSPDIRYLCYNHDDAFIVLKPYGGICHLLELQGNDRSVDVLLRMAKTLCRRHGWTELNAWFADSARFSEALLENGFRPSVDASHAIVMIGVAINSDVPQFAGRSSHLPMGLEEMY